ncbi:hypothetical protein EA73_01009 [Enterococcus faecium]|uniref:DUF1642 domain-containing protein n=1 Tax=Enterococcus faecium TaxID=1352 RepID=UPI000DE9A83B|nr:DUF1642 domain-containing protein [Enterococcus faecium]RBT35357.1 hypothetical protein EA73_01009 [Enterococcus faecium]
MNKKVLIDKQALINKLTKYVERYEGATDEYYQGKRSAYEIALKSAKKLGLDEPQKPVGPKFVAEWIELCKEKADLNSCLSGSYEYGVNQFEADHQELVARAWLYGYEVEKEPLYRVKIGEGYFVEYQGRGALIMPDCNKEIKIFDSKSDAERTAQTIGGTVEEVAER